MKPAGPWWWVIGAAAVAVAAALPGIGVRSTYGAQLAGDEPHYLLTAISLAEDRNLDVADELAAQRYRTFHEAALPQQAAETPAGRRVVPHDPLLPALLALPWWLGGWVGSELVLVATHGALAALLVWTAVRRVAIRPRTAFLVVAVFAASAPLAVYGSQVYPELPAALAVTAAVAALLGPPRRAPWAALAVVALPWLAAKYVPVAAVLAALLLWRLRSREHRRTAALVATVLLVAGLGYVLAHLRWYGGLTVYAAGDFFQEHGGQLAVVGTDPDYLGRSPRLVGLLLGRTFGLAAWQPAWLLLVPALAALVRRRPRGWELLVAPLLVGWLTATYVAVTMQGWWFPGRQLVVVLPLVVLAVAWWADEARNHLAITVAVGALGVATLGYLLAEGLRAQLTWVVDFASTTNPWYRVWAPALPDYLPAGARGGPGIGVGTRTWVIQGLWLGVFAAAGVWSWRRAGRRELTRSR